MSLQALHRELLKLLLSARLAQPVVKGHSNVSGNHTTAVSCRIPSRDISYLYHEVVDRCDPGASSFPARLDHRL